MTTDIRDRLWEQAEPHLFIAKDEFLKNLDGWEIKPVEVDGELAFATLVKGPAFHFQSFGTRHPISLRMIKEFLRTLIDQHGYATTKTPKEDTRQHRFNRLLGFQAVGEDEFDIHYRIEKI